MAPNNAYPGEQKKNAEKVTAEYHRISKYHKISKIRSCVLLISTATTGNRVAKRFVIGFIYLTECKHGFSECL